MQWAFSQIVLTLLYCQASWTWLANRIFWELVRTHAVGLHPQSFWFSRSGWGFKTCVSIEFLGDAASKTTGLVLYSNYVWFLSSRGYLPISGGTLVVTGWRILLNLMGRGQGCWWTASSGHYIIPSLQWRIVWAQIPTALRLRTTSLVHLLGWELCHYPHSSRYTFLVPRHHRELLLPEKRSKVEFTKHFIKEKALHFQWATHFLSCSLPCRAHLDQMIFWNQWNLCLGWDKGWKETAMLILV